jgi:hypothetical protein
VRSSGVPAAPRTTTVRPSEEDSSEPPPPPYSRQDPEPEATAQLARQLSNLPPSAQSSAALGSSIPTSGSGAQSGEGEEERAEDERMMGGL